MIANMKLIKGCFTWSIPLLLFACNSLTPASVKKVDPANCEWYVDKSDDKNNLQKLDVYALRFYPDSSYTLCADLLFETGKWKLDDEKKALVLTPSVKNESFAQRFIIVQSLENNRAEFMFFHKYPPEPEKTDERIKAIAVNNQSAFDPYNKKMHSWRQKPLQEETPAQIKQRTLAYLLFLQSLYQHAKDNNLENPGGTWYPHPIQFYSNTVSMAYADDLIDWNNCFYNDAQAVEGYKLISGALMKTKIEGKDDVSRNINCVNQLLNEIKK